MVDHGERPSDLPSALRRAAGDLRAMTHPAGFERRLARALEAADAKEALRQDGSPGAPARSSKVWETLLMTCPAIAAMVVTVLLGRALLPSAEPHADRVEAAGAQADSFFHRFEERAVASAPSGESAWVDLDLWTHHHGDQDATVHLDAPTSVRVKASEHSTLHAAPRCGAERCVHSFVTRTAHRSSATPLRIGIDAPGKYHIHIEHASPGVRVSEFFVVNVAP
jgi:hypothetical protein